MGWSNGRRVCGGHQRAGASVPCPFSASFKLTTGFLQLTPSEIQALHSRADQPQRLHYALALWTLKEAYIKATGDGLHFDLQRLDFHLPNLDETSEFTTAGFARLDGAPLRGRRFQLVQLVSEVAREPYWLALAEQAADGQGEVDVVRGARPDCVREVSLGEMLDVAG